MKAKIIVDARTKADQQREVQREERSCVGLVIHPSDNLPMPAADTPVMAVTMGEGVGGQKACLLVYQ